MELLWPWAFALLPLPLLLRRLLPAARSSAGDALRVPFFSQLQQAGMSDAARSPKRLLTLLLMALCWLLLLTALARPVLVGKPIAVPVTARDLMMAIDLSGSMGRDDFAYNGRPVPRLAVVKAVADDFIARRQGDRIGLILFSDRAYLQTPLTLDRQVVRQLLGDAEVGLTGRETAIGDAIGLAIKQLRDRPEQNRVLILLTDGTSNAGVLKPLQAADLAQQEGVRIYTIGVGAGAQRVQSMLGSYVVDPSQDLDEQTLAEIAKRTGGQYFRARDIQGLADIYRQIDQLEPVEGDPVYLHPTTSLMHWPLGTALLLSLLIALMPLLRGVAWPRPQRQAKAAQTAGGNP